MPHGLEKCTKIRDFQNRIKFVFHGYDDETVSYKATNLLDSTDIYSGNASPEPNFCFKNKCPFKFELNGLSEGATYRLEISANNQLLSKGKIKTIKINMQLQSNVVCK